MSELNRQDIIAMGRLLYHHKLCELWRSLHIDKADELKSSLEKQNVSCEKLEQAYNTELSKHLEQSADKEKELSEIAKEITMPFEDIVAYTFKDLTGEKRQPLYDIAKAITERGNDMQVTHSKDGLKVFEVSKKLVKVIPS